LNCEGDERPSEEQRAYPIVYQEYQFEFPKGQIAVGESFDVCAKVADKTLINSPSNQREEITFNID
jgi:hypothetical protein